MFYIQKKVGKKLRQKQKRNRTIFFPMLFSVLLFTSSQVKNGQTFFDPSSEKTFMHMASGCSEQKLYSKW